MNLDQREMDQKKEEPASSQAQQTLVELLKRKTLFQPGEKTRIPWIPILAQDNSEIQSIQQDASHPTRKPETYWFLYRAMVAIHVIMKTIRKLDEKNVPHLSFLPRLHPSYDDAKEEAECFETFLDHVQGLTGQQFEQWLSSQWHDKATGQQLTHVRFILGKLDVPMAEAMIHQIKQDDPNVAVICLVTTIVPTPDFVGFVFRNNERRREQREGRIYLAENIQTARRKKTTTAVKKVKDADMAIHGKVDVPTVHMEDQDLMDEEQKRQLEEKEERKRTKTEAATKSKRAKKVSPKKKSISKKKKANKWLDESEEEAKPVAKKSSKKKTNKTMVDDLDEAPATKSTKKKTSKSKAKADLMPVEEMDPVSAAVPMIGKISLVKGSSILEFEHMPRIEVLVSVGQLSSHFFLSEDMPHAEVLTDPQAVYDLNTSLNLTSIYQHRKLLTTDPVAILHGLHEGDMIMYSDFVADRGETWEPAVVVNDTVRHTNIKSIKLVRPATAARGS